MARLGPRRFFLQMKDGNTEVTEGRTQSAQRQEGAKRESKGEDLEVAAAGEDDGEEAAVAGEAEFADGDAVEKDAGGRLGDGDGLSRGVSDHGRNREFREIGGFFFEGALEIDAGFIGGPLDDTETNAEAGNFARSGEIAHFEDFLVEIVGDFGAGGREGEAPGEGIEGGDFGGVLR